MDVLEKISALARGVAETHNVELVDIELFRAGRRRMVRLYIGKASGVGVEDCARVSRELSTLLDAEDVLEGEAYTLEVSSPGLDRPFKTLGDWRRNLGREVRVTCREPVDGKFQYQGRLETVDENTVQLDCGGRKQNIPLNQVALAKLEIKIP
ncbi:MAG TPA: ribosome maturation factor RimP [Fibrobacteres bacterium]|jgi:ribosome maturation factor RimP|nr:ribosome maturation factor RimP [Fibrobacterota bacterium]